MARWIPCWCWMALLCWGMSPSLALAQQANQGAAKQEAAQRKAKLARGGTWVGKIAALDEDPVSFLFEVQIVISHVEILPSYLDRRGLPTEYRVRRGEHRETIRQTVWLPDDVKVRLHHKPETDAKERPLRAQPMTDPKDPDSKLGGVQGSLKDLRKNQTIKVKLERNREGHLFAAFIHVLGEDVTP